MARYEKYPHECIEGTVAGFDFDARYRVKSWKIGCAVYVRGPVKEYANDAEDEDDYSLDYDRLVVVMVGDDARHVVDRDDLELIAREDYCGECGQIGCAHDGLDREDGVA